MTSRRAIQGVLHNFLATYTSRNTDYDGYWLFGMLVGYVEEPTIDLLSPDRESEPVAAAIQLASQKFLEQWGKAGMSASYAQKAQLEITQSPDLHRGIVNGRMCVGHTFRFLARIVSKYGKTYESAMSVFVAPHDSRLEMRSTRGT